MSVPVLAAVDRWRANSSIGQTAAHDSFALAKDIDDRADRKLTYLVNLS
jgi:hypothetical protein